MKRNRETELEVWRANKAAFSRPALSSVTNLPTSKRPIIKAQDVKPARRAVSAAGTVQKENVIVSLPGSRLPRLEAAQPTSTKAPDEQKRVATVKMNVQPEPARQQRSVTWAASPENDSSKANLAPRPSGALDIGGPAASTDSLHIAARLETLRRETLRLSVQPAASNGGGWEPAGQFETKSLAALAEELFEHEKFKAACDKSLTTTLQRTRDGATAESRIQELAGLVKILRRCLTQMTAKTQQYVVHSIKFEKEAAQQVESVKLASESASKQVEVELAHAKRDLAQAAAAHKSAAASWQGELDWHKCETSRVRRELERVEHERDRAREDARRAETGCLALEAEVKVLKKEAGQQVRDAQAELEQALRSLGDAHHAARLREQKLQAEVQAEAGRAEEAASSCAAVKAELQVAQMELEQLQGVQQQTEHTHNKLLAQHKQVEEAYQTQRAVHAQVVENSTRILADFNELQERCAGLLAQLEERQAAAVAAAEQLAAAVQAHAQERAAWQNASTRLQEEAQALADQQAALVEEKAQLKAGLGSALQQKAELEASLATAAAQHAAQQQQLAHSLATEAAHQEQLAQLRREVEGVRQEAEAAGQEAQRERDAARLAQAEASVKQTRLAHLEGEMEAFTEVIGVGEHSQMLSHLVSRVAGLETALAATEAKRRALHNQLVELRGNIRVFCRVRPNPASVVSCQPDGASLRIEADGKDHPFAFDRVFGPVSSQQDIFNEVSELVQSALDGYKVCLFSYGQTGAGKTHTMQGSRSPSGQGIMPRAVRKILEAVEALRGQGWEYSLEARFIEVYNETLRDLLVPPTPGRVLPPTALDQNAIKHDPTGGATTVAGAVVVPIACAEDCDEVVRRASAARAVELTAMNATSSRSHSVFMLAITGRNDAAGSRLQGALNLVDLAGSERLARSGVEGQRQKEACSINKSLSSLGDVFGALAAKSPHIPYRNSKLTLLLQPCLGGDGKTLMLVNINPEPESANESLCSLRFAAKVNTVTSAKGGVKRNISQIDDAAARQAAKPSGGVQRRPATGAPSSVRNVRARVA